MTGPYIPLLFLIAIGGGFAVFSVVIAGFTGPKRYNRAKLDAYECGNEPTPHASGGGKVPIKYYLTAMLFIIFDIESVFLYPFAVAFSSLGLFALVEMVLFILTVFVLFRRHFPVWQANLLQMVIFVAFLWELGYQSWGPLLTIPFALLQGWIYSTTKSLVYVLSVHLLFDAVVFLVIVHARNPGVIPFFLL